MAVLYVLNVPEFAPLVNYAEGAAELTVRDHGNYKKIETTSELVIPRAATGMDPAIWFGALVGGFDGSIDEFSEDILKISA